MKKIAIILGILCFAQAAFAGGTMLYEPVSPYTQNPMTAPANPNDTFVTAGQGMYPQQQEQTVSSKRTREGKIRIGSQKNDPNAYWNFGRVNFGSGFSSEGSSTKRF